MKNSDYLGALVLAVMVLAVGIKYEHAVSAQGRFLQSSKARDRAIMDAIIVAWQSGYQFRKTEEAGLHSPAAEAVSLWSVSNNYSHALNLEK